MCSPLIMGSRMSHATSVMTMPASMSTARYSKGYTCIPLGYRVAENSVEHFRADMVIRGRRTLRATVYREGT